MATARTKRPLAPRAITSNDKDVAELANQFASGLRIAEAAKPRNGLASKTKVPRAAAKAAEDPKSAAMKNVNTVLQSLTSAIQSNWKTTTARSGSSFTTAGLSKLATTARASLTALRKLNPGALDVERAALSTVGKLVTLEMTENALDILTDIQPHISSYYENSGPHSSSKLSTQQLSFLFLPLPTTFPIEANLQTLISTYLTHAQTIAASLVSSTTGMSQVLAKRLDEPGGFASWVSFYTDLPDKTIGSLIKRYYVLLTSTTTAPPALPTALLSIRFHALRALLLTSESMSHSFWEQCLKFASAYAKSVEPPESEMEKSRTMLSCFECVLKAVEARHDVSSMMSGKGWIMFCEYWLSLAKRTADLDSLNKAVTHIRNAASSSHDSTQESMKGQPSVDSRSESKSLFSSRASASFAQTCTLLEGDYKTEESKDLSTSINSSVSCLQELRKMYTTHTLTCLDSKLRRGIEKVRRTCLKVLHAESRAAHLQVRTVVESIIDFIEIAIPLDESQANLTEYTVSALDSLFGLATSTANPQNLDTCDKAFSYLAQGSRIIDLFEKRTTSSGPEVELSCANFTRCLSGAFFNIAATLYKAENFGSAIRFLLQACPMAVKAMNLRNASLADKVTAKGKDKETVIDKDVDAWKTHEEQLHRRWELLAVCYTKTGERKLAHDAFVRGVVCYPFASASSSVVEGSMSDDCLNTESHKQLCAMIDRLTYIGAAEILMEKQVSLLQPLQEASVPDLVISAVLMRQIRSLDESRWKPLVQRVIGFLLDDLLTVLSKKHPMRRSKALVMQLEHFYYAGGATSMLRVADNVEEVQNLLKNTADLHYDHQFASLRPYYLSLSKIWEIFLAHRCGESLQELKQRTVEFLEKIESLSRKSSDLPLSAQSSSSNNCKAKKAAAPVRKGRVLAATRKPVAAKVVRKSPVTPKPRRSLDAQPLQDKMCGYADTEVPQECATLISHLVILSELLNIMGLTLPRMQVLHTGKLLAEKAGYVSSDTYVYICTALAYNLLRIGKFAQSKALLSNISGQFKESQLPEPAKVLLLLRQAEILAFTDGHAESVAHYEEANKISQDLTADEKGLSTSARVREKVASLERAALAAGVFATIQDMKGDLAASLNSNLQRLRLLNKATELLAKLSSPKKSEGPSEDGDPFAMSDLKEALPIVDHGINALPSEPERTAPQRESRTFLGGQEWRIATLLLETMHVLCRLYFIRGSAREAEYFANQAEELSKALHSPVHTVQALLRKSEIFLYLGQVENSEETLDEALRHLEDPEVLAHVDARWMKGNQLQKRTKVSEAAGEYKEAWEVITSSETAFKSFDNIDTDSQMLSRQGLTQDEQEPKRSFLPLLQAAVLRERVWLKRDELDDEYSELLQQLMSLPQLPDILANVDYLLGRLAVHDIHDRFRSDMSLNSLAESIIALPMGMTQEKSILYSPSQDVQEALDQADELLSEGLKKHATRNDVLQLRNIAVSGALVNIYQASLGNASAHGPSLAARLLDMAASITIRRELLEAISFKSISVDHQDDEKWPSESPGKLSLKPSSRSKPSVQSLFAQLSDDSDDESLLGDSTMRKYWEFISKKYEISPCITQINSTSEIDSFPSKWMVISITLTEDKNALLISRQLPNHEPIVFCIPLRGRRDDEEEHFTYDDAMSELQDIIRMSDEGTRRALDILTNDKDGKAAWWTERKQLDERLKELVGNVEFCWLGAFKTILSQPMRMPPDALSNFRKRLEKVFESMLNSYEKKSQKGNLKLDNGLLELLSTLPPNCRDEELEDIIYFVLDLYHFHGLPVALAEVDVDVVAVHLRTALEEHHARMRGRVVPEPDAHTFLVLDKHVQPFPWESMPILRGRSVSRVPSIAFISDRLALARCQRGLPLESDEVQTAELDRIDVNPSKGYFVLNPGGDLARTEERFKGWANDMKRVGWGGIIGSPPSEQQFLNALSRKDLVVYFGHGGAEQYVRSHKIRHLSRCAATMLWGCSSGELRDMGDFDRIGTPNNYMIAGCPTLVANLWDVTDRDIDKFALAVFDKMNIHPKEVEKWQKGKKRAEEGRVSIAAAVAQSRDACKLKYLTGAAVVVYGIPFYL